MKFQNVAIVNLRVDPSYQRPCSSARVRKMAREWNDDLAMALSVNVRPDGDMYVWDGQHRLEAAKLAGLQKIPCLVESFGSSEEEARRYFEVQGAGRKNLMAIDLFRAKLAARQKEEVAIFYAAESEGFTISHSTKRGNIRAVAALYRCVRLGGHDTNAGIAIVRTVLRAIREAWDSSNGAANYYILMGMAKFIKGYPGIDVEHLIMKLKRVSAEEVTRDIKNHVHVCGGGLANVIGGEYVFVQLYNKGRRTGRLEVR